jgi:hypothetical protein
MVAANSRNKIARHDNIGNLLQRRLDIAVVNATGLGEKVAEREGGIAFFLKRSKLTRFERTVAIKISLSNY